MGGTSLTRKPRAGADEVLDLMGARRGRQVPTGNLMEKLLQSPLPHPVEGFFVFFSYYY